MMHTAHNSTHPARLALNEIGRRVQVLRLGEQIVNLINAVGQEAVLQTSVALYVLHYRHKLIVRKLVLLGLLIGGLVEYIVLHRSFSSFRFFSSFAGFCLAVLHGRADHCVHYGFLFLRKCIEHIGDSFVIIGFGFLCVFFFGLFLLFPFIRVGKREGITDIGNHSLVLFQVIHILSVYAHLVDIRPRICPRQNQTHFSDGAVDHIRAVLFELVGINRKTGNVAMLYHELRGFTGLGGVEQSVGVHAVLSVFQNCVTQNVVNGIVLVVPNQRNLFPVTILESVFSDDTIVGAFQVAPGRPSAEIVLHFEFLTSL